jgi:hypothetical protein
LVSINDNQIDAEKAQDGGIIIFGGVGNEKETNAVNGNNIVTALVSGNKVDNPASCGICAAGGLGLSPTVQATRNHVTVDIKDNTVTQAKYQAIIAAGGWSASESTAEVMIANNTVTGSGGNGIEVNGGTAQDRGDNRQGASSNTAMGTIQGNTVQASTFSDIAVFGGFDAAKGSVTGNRAVQRLSRNAANNLLCQDGIPGNKAECTFANASTETEEQSSSSSQREEKAITVQPAVMPLLNQLDERITDFRARAQEATTPESAAELTRLAERLAERKAQIMMRQKQ